MCIYIFKYIYILHIYLFFLLPRTQFDAGYILISGLVGKSPCLLGKLRCLFGEITFYFAGFILSSARLQVYPIFSAFQSGFSASKQAMVACLRLSC